VSVLASKQDPDRRGEWICVLGRFKQQVGEDAFRNWLRPLLVERVEAGHATVIAPTYFLRDWVTVHYASRLLALWQEEDPGLTSLAILAHGSQEGAITASLSVACLQAVDFTGAKLGGANLDNAAITDSNGQIQVSYYDQSGGLFGPIPITWQATGFPSEASFSNTTVCPNGSTYGSNKQQGSSIAQMMQAQKPPAQWTPRVSYKR
jgi:chromosomal replication initiation ATPase DnaA